ncbi:MAG: radical SAM protein [Desulfuromonadaceae bacterium]|nr:radical SAM protein [Desulfuromonadaceae bacterium]MDD2850070.1 radical SAM protein [Desulfuromonadaceae bacterium]MDD4131858.1 radical SAM protein [Desulfuromonadaceae bacterium]
MMAPETAAVTTLLNTTQSVCPVCLDVVDAQVVAEGKVVYMKKECPEHGDFTTYLWPDVDHYNWMNSFKFPCVKPDHTGASLKGCPQDCGLCTSHLRHPTLVEIELTERCNLRCPVCFMAAEGVQAAAQPGPSLSELESVFKGIMAKTGPYTSIQLTGGEPTIRKDLPDIVRLGRSIGFTSIELNTNGVVISQRPEYVRELAEAGISGIFMQFDGLTSAVYEKIRGADLLSTKLKAIENCRKAGVQVVIAMTIINGINQDQIGDVLRFALDNRDVIAGIAYQPAFGSGRFEVSNERRLSMGDVAFLLSEQSNGILAPYDLWPLGCSHPTCDAATYVVEEKGRYRALTSMITTKEYVENFDPASPQGSVLPDIADKMFPELELGLSIVVMSYMDATDMDLKRLRECSMTVAGPDGALIPFCSYQLTNIHGQKRAEILAGKAA